jgi:TorA maturation chaperone TorD
MDDASIAREHAALFGGVGKPEVYVYASHYLSGFLNEKPLAQLRADLAALGLTRDASTMSETEDHVSYVMEVMRFLVAGDDVAVSNLTQQARFFAAHVQPWVSDLCDALQANPRARFYAALAGLTRAFVGVETQAFDLLT